MTLLPTPGANLADNGGPQHPDKRRAGGHSVSLDDAGHALLPTPKATNNENRSSAWASGPNLGEAIAALLPTPTADHSRGLPTSTGYQSLANTAVALLPTPTVSEATGAGAHGAGGPNLRSALLPTPRATDGTKGGPNQRGSSGDIMLPSAVQLLPTPTATPYGNNHSASPGATVRPSLTSMPADRWGDYAPAIARWEQAIGRPAPDPTKPGRTGKPRLNPQLVEWMMGWPPGHVIDVPGITDAQALRICGNGVVPQQSAAATRALLHDLAREAATA